MKKEDIEKKVKSRMVYLHRRVDKDGKEKHVWLRLGVGENRLGKDAPAVGNPKFDLWVTTKAKNLVKGAGVGSVYDFPSENDGGTVWAGHAEYLYHWPHDEDRVLWQANHRAGLAFKDSLAAKMRETRRKLDAESLEPFRQAFYDLPARQRNALLGWIIAEVTKPPKGRR